MVSTMLARGMPRAGGASRFGMGRSDAVLTGAGGAPPGHSAGPVAEIRQDPLDPVVRRTREAHGRPRDRMREGPARRVQRDAAALRAEIGEHRVARPPGAPSPVRGLAHAGMTE